MAEPSQNSFDYYRGREQHELRQAHSAASHGTRDIHLEMAQSYRKMLEQLEAHGPESETSSPDADPTDSGG